MDIYAIICIFTLVAQCVWHAVICAIIFLNTPNFSVTPSMWFVTFDQAIFFAVVGILIILHVTLLIWLYIVPYGHRKKMAEIDFQFKLAALHKKKDRKKKSIAKQSKKSSSVSRVVMEKEVEIKPFNNDDGNSSYSF
jgi:hypothetical protein